MSEEQNIPQRNSKEQIPNPNKEIVNEKTSQHFPEDIRAPKQPQTIKEMEVHHHGHVHHQKNGKNIFFNSSCYFSPCFAGSWQSTS